ncbi:MAG: methionine--tRNA ligase [Planctomycetota bacterium]|nr:MAG: methionine--tRNA ligase [Planctomycetota bacterium]
MPRYLVTSALPYANGPIHFGHITGAYLPADVYVRTLRMQGEEVLFVCGTDEHGVAITVNAEAEKKAYPEYVAHWRDEIKRTFDRYGIEFDVWSGTSASPPHAALSQHFFTRLDDRGYLVQKVQEQLYCTQCPRFLADRYVEGTCYVCGHEKARGDECPKCASWLEPLKLVNPRCKVCGSAPERRSTRHWYLDLPKLRDAHIGAWFAAHPWKQNVKGYIGNQLAEIEPRPITRDMSWGVPLPADRAHGESGKVLYVWFDAPIGYVSFTQEWAAAKGEPDAWKRWWRDADTRLVHFIGKDNIPFHCLVFPSMLFGVGEDYVLPWHVPANEFYNLEGRKFSTSQRWTIPPLEFADTFDAESARFYLVLSMPEGADSEWRWDEFQACNNSQLADKIGNLASRVLRFLEKNYEGKLPGTPKELEAELDRVLLAECGALGDPGESVREFRFRRAAETLLANAVAANVYIDRLAPWALRKTDPARAGAVLDTCCQYLALVARWLAPFTPNKAQALWQQLGCSGRVADAGWPKAPQAGAWRTLPAGQKLGAISGLFPKVESAAIAAERAKLGA